MKDRINESLSALCDGECDELELRRVLNHISSNPEMREQWHRYHLIGALMRGEAATTSDLSRGVMQAIEQEDESMTRAADQHAECADEVRPEPQDIARRAMPEWLVSGAVAASVTLAVLFGARVMNDVTSAPDMGLVQVNSTPAQPVELKPLPIDAAAPVVVGEALAAGDVSGEELRRAQEALRQYVLEHEDQMITNPAQGTAPYARVANFGGDSTLPRKD